MEEIFLLLAIVFFVTSGSLYFPVLMEVQSRFPAILSDELTARCWLGSFIWDRSVPGTIQRQYISSSGFGAAAIGMIAAFFIIREGWSVPSWLFSFVTLLALGSIARDMAKYRAVKRSSNLIKRTGANDD